MKSYVFGSSAAIYIDEKDVQEAALQNENMARLVEKALGHEWKGARVEMFQANGSAMLFVCREKEACVFTFDAMEELLKACSLCKEDISSSLLWYNDRYLLILFEKAPPHFDEFGERSSIAHEAIDHIKEHGKVIIENNAVRKLKTLF